MRTSLLHFISILSALIFSFSNAYSQDITYVKTSYNLLSDGNVELVFNVEIQDGWHMYSAVEVENGPLSAVFEPDENSSFELVGKMKDVSTPIKMFDQGFGVDVFYFEGSAKMIQVIKPLNTGNFTVSGTFVCQTCDGGECLTNENAVSISVKTDGKQVEATTVPSKGKGGEQSLWIFLLIAFAAGLGGVVTPCVFPMIPMTVGFLVGGGNSKHAGIMKGLIFGLSVIAIYVLLGLVVALFESTTTTDVLGTHWIPNLIFALLFLVFAISFLGAFEITLPNGLANKADKQADKGGYVAAFFVALAMVIVSFSCTGPFVGSILAASVSGGVALKPILGMAVFGLAFSLPFVLFSFFPGVMKKLPKSGGWLNVVKVVFAFVLLGFALKYFYNVDAYFGWGFISRLGFLSIWIALALILGLYFLDAIRTNHDSPTQGIGWGRMVAAIICFAFAFYLIPGLFGAPLKTVSGLIPPQDGSTIVLASGNGGNGTSGSVSTGGYSSIESFSSVDKALAEAGISGKPAFLYFKSHTCSVCKMMEATVLNEPAVLDLLKNNFVVANLYVDDKSADEQYKTLGKRLRAYEMEHFGSASQPLYVIVDASGNTLSGPVGSCSVDEFIQFLTIK